MCIRDRYKECQNDSERRQFALKLRLDPEGSWCKVTESSAIRNSNTNSAQEGWLAIWEVAKLEGVAYSPKDDESMELLWGLVENCKSMPHPKNKLASSGHRVHGGWDLNSLQSVSQT
eukprot:1628011-Alexandrium_andersonii.AAC.1